MGEKGVRGDKGDRGLTTTLKGDQFPTGIIEGPPGPPGPPGNDKDDYFNGTTRRLLCSGVAFWIFFVVVNSYLANASLIRKCYFFVYIYILCVISVAEQYDFRQR